MITRPAVCPNFLIYSFLRTIRLRIVKHYYSDRQSQKVLTCQPLYKLYILSFQLWLVVVCLWWMHMSRWKICYAEVEEVNYAHVYCLYMPKNQFTWSVHRNLCFTRIFFSSESIVAFLCCELKKILLFNFMFLCFLYLTSYCLRSVSGHCNS